MNQQWQDYINIVQSVVKPALGCTEPISAAYAAAVAAQMLDAPIDRLEIRVSDNLYKNAMGVFVPGTGKIGLAIAAAVGAIGGDANAGLEVLANINAADVTKLKRLLMQIKSLLRVILTPMSLSSVMSKPMLANIMPK